jgi:UV DNA damage endonuclease
MQPELSRLADAIRAARLRISAHPGQYTVLNSPRPEVVESSRVELDYHARLLESLGGGPEAKIVLHLGGVYGDKPASLARFIDNFARLPEGARRRLVLENDEKSYTLADALFVSQRTGAPVVFDIFHHTWNPSLDGQPLTELIRLAGQTWSAADGRQKIHYSNPWPGKPKGSHSQSVDVDAFAEFYAQVRDLDLDIMLEVKDKQESVLALYERFPELKPA